LLILSLIAGQMVLQQALIQKSKGVSLVYQGKPKYLVIFLAALGGMNFPVTVVGVSNVVKNSGGLGVEICTLYQRLGDKSGKGHGFAFAA